MGALQLTSPYGGGIRSPSLREGLGEGNPAKPKEPLFSTKRGPMNLFSRFTRTLLFVVLLVLSFSVVAVAQSTRPDIASSRTPAVAKAAVSNVPCENGSANEYACNNIDLLSFLPLSDIGGGEGADIWGWTDSTTGKEYALLARTNGVSMIDVSDPMNPVFLGNLLSHNGSSIWRDVKVYQNHAYIVADSLPNHHLQIFDLTTLRSITSPPQILRETAVYEGIGSAHNIHINEETGFGYIVGAGFGGTSCNGGLHVIDLSNPAAPTFAGCFSDDGYTHDTQCVVYNGTDAAHVGSEICFNANEDSLTIVDVTDKNNMQMLARQGYAGSAYAHQGWITADHTYFIMNDEIDETNFGHNTRTYIWDIRDLDNPRLVDFYEADVPSIDHNLYIHDNIMYQANYTSGLRVFSLENLAQAGIKPVGFFDTHPLTDSPFYNGAWSNYPFFESGTIIVSDINRGFFALQIARLFEASVVSVGQPLPLGQTVEHTITVQNLGSRTDSYNVQFTGNSWDTNSATTVGPLAPGEETTLTIAVTIGTGFSDTVSVRLTSAGDNSLQHVLSITTQADSTRVFLPSIRN